MNDWQRTQIHQAMVRLASGDRDAFSIVFDGLWPHVLEFVNRSTSGHPDSEDLAQQTLLKIFARISDFDVAQDGVAWAFGIAAYEVKTLRRQVQRRRETATDGVLDDAAAREPSAEHATISADLHRALTEALGHLSSSDRATLLGETTDESAHVTASAWRKRRQRALQRLRVAWSKRHA